jgi:hypothetical protein
MLLLLEMKVARRTTNTSASAFVAKGPVPPSPVDGLPPPSMGGGQQWRTNPHHGGYGKNKRKNKVYKPATAPPAPTLYNPCTGAIQMWPMPQPADHGILGPRPGPRANAFMASPPRRPCLLLRHGYVRRPTGCRAWCPLRCSLRRSLQRPLWRPLRRPLHRHCLPHRAPGLGAFLGHLCARSALQQPDAAASFTGVHLRQWCHRSPPQ